MNNSESEIISTLKAMGFEESKIMDAMNLAEFKTVESVLNKIEEIDSGSNEVLISISDKVNKLHLDVLLQLGYSKNAAEKALFMNGNNFDKAKQWLIDNKNLPDFNEELFIVQQVNNKSNNNQPNNINNNAKPNPPMDPEVAKQKARELQIKLAKDRAEREKKESLENEKKRMEEGKKIAEAKKIFEEQQLKRDLEFQKLEKEKVKKEKEKMLEILEKDKIERFGKDYVEKKKIKSVEEDFNEIYTTMKKVYLTSTNGEIDTCLKTIKIYVENILKDPANDKFKAIKTTNPAFCKRVGDIVGGIVLLQRIGFIQEGEFLNLKTYDQERITQFYNIIMSKLNC